MKVGISFGGANLRIFRVRGRMNREFRRGVVYIGIEGARRVQMRCGFRPRDRDRTTEMMEQI